MNISEIKERLSQEREFGSRFPARIIFVDNLDDYILLENQLRGICEITLNIADFCRASDTVPQFDRIQTKLNGCEGKQVLLLSVGEYLRLCIKRELNTERRQFISFWETQQSEASKTRVIIPMFCSHDIFDRVVGSVDERQQDFLWNLDTALPKDNYSICVFSPRFKDTIIPDASNISEWLKNWPALLSKGDTCNIVTLQESNVEASYGTVSIKPINSPFLYLTDFLTDGSSLDETWADNDFWNKLIKYVSSFQEKVSFSQIALFALNIKEFDFISIAARWGTLSGFQQKLVWMWYRLYPTSDYFSFVCRKTLSASDIPAQIRDEILLMPDRSILWIEQRMSAMKAFGFLSFSDAYFALMDKIPLPETKLSLLTFQTHEEQTYAVKIISGLLRDGAEPDSIAELISESYPALSVYLKGDTGCDEMVDRYMTWYRRNKLINRFPGEYPIAMTYDRFDARYKLIHKYQDKDCVTFWIDGFGVEYVPLFVHELEARKIIPCSLEIATSLLPTETDYNHQWDAHDSLTVKWDRLDSYSHRGIPDDKSYFSCIVYQLSVFADAARKVEELLENHEYVIITGDHGSSRFAALSFHTDSVAAVTAPKNSKIHNYGRFCELDDKSKNMIALPETTKVNAKNGEKTFLVMNNYQHFSIGGNVAGGNTDDHDIVGEIHGGNTVEERLVSVIVVKRKRKLVPIECKPKNKYITKRNGHIEATLLFSQTLTTLEVWSGKNKAICTENPDGSWQVSLDSVSDDNIILSVIANERLLPKITLKVKTQGINKNIDPFGGIGI